MSSSLKGSSSYAREKDDDDQLDSISEPESWEDDEFGTNYREKRLESMKQEVTRLQEMKENDHGRVTRLQDEKEIINRTAKGKKVVVHFFHPDFRRCTIMDKHLADLAPKYFDTLFLRVDVADVPFLVTRLEIKILPCVIAFISGVTKDRITGFEGLAEVETDEFTTAQLELRLKQSGVIGNEAKQPTRVDERRSIM